MKTDKNFKQKGQKIGGAGGFFNQLMSHNSTVPVVGEGATELMYSDRHAYEVLEVNEKEKSCTIDRYNPKRIDNLGMSDSQTYEYKELYGNPFKLYWKYGAWRKKHVTAIFTDEFHAKYPNGYELHGAYKALGGEYNNNSMPITVIEGVTKKKTKWYKMNIIFGTRREYYDFSF